MKFALPVLQRQSQIPHRLFRRQRSQVADWLEAHPFMESIGPGIWRVCIDLACDAGVAGSPGFGDQIVIKTARQPLPLVSLRNDHPVYIDKAFKPRLHPGEIGILVRSRLVESDQERALAASRLRIPRHCYQFRQPRRRQRGCL